MEYVLSFTKPIMSMIRYADTNNPCWGEIYDGMDYMVEKIRAIIEAKKHVPTKILVLTVGTK